MTSEHARTRPVRMGVLGCSAIARRRTIPAMIEVPGVEPAAVAARDAERARAYAAEFGVEAAAGYADLVDRPDIDALYVSLPAGLHHEWITRALRAGKHVLAEKPLTASHAHTADAVGLARSRGLALMENLTFTRHGLHARVRDLLEEGAIGALRTVSGAFAFPPLPSDDIRYRPELGGGALLDAGVYPLGAARLFLGSGLSVVGATLKTSAEHGVDVAGNALLCSSDGRTAQVTFGFEHGYRCEYVLWGSAGRIVVDRAFTPPPTLRPVIRLERQDEVREFTVSADDQFAATLAEFARAVRDPRIADGAAELDRARLVDQVRTRARVLGPGGGA